MFLLYCKEDLFGQKSKGDERKFLKKEREMDYYIKNRVFF